MINIYTVYVLNFRGVVYMFNICDESYKYKGVGSKRFVIYAISAGEALQGIGIGVAITEFYRVLRTY